MNKGVCNITNISESTHDVCGFMKIQAHGLGAKASFGGAEDRLQRSSESSSRTPAPLAKEAGDVGACD